MKDDYLASPLSFGSSPTQVVDPKVTRESNEVRPTLLPRPATLSPYLNYDPRFIQQAEPEFIFPAGANKQRGRFELAFSQIGSSVIIGAGIGGTAGFYNGLQTTKALQQTGKLFRTQMINHVMKQGAATANTFGTLAVMYSAFGVILQTIRGEDDNINTVIAGTSTGLLYKSTAGLRKCAIGGGVGLGVSAAYCLFMWSRNRF